MATNPWGWGSTVAQFLATEEQNWVEALISHHKSRLKELALDIEQIQVWHETFQLCD